MQAATPPVVSGRIGRMLDDKAIQAAASALEEAERSRKQIRLLSETYPEITMDDAYAIQDCWIGMKLAAGEKLAGWKIGLTSKAMQASVSIDIPDSGALLESMRFPNGAVIVPGRFIQPRIEAEIAFVMKGPLEGTATAEDVLAATDYIAPALEILDTRIARKDPQTGKLRTVYDTISDNAADGGFVLGDAVTDFSGLDMRWLGAIVSRDGEVEETGLSAGVLNNPLMSVAWLAQRLATYGHRIEAGQVILSGSFIRPIEAIPGSEIVGDFGTFGHVSCQFE